MDVILVAPREISKGDKMLFRENNNMSDIEALSINPINSLFLHRFRENLGIGALAACLKENGQTVKIIDSNLSELPFNDMVMSIVNEDPKLVGISLLYDLHSYYACRLIKQLRKCGYKGHITIGGAFSTSIYEHFLAAFPELDSVIRGEGERTILELTQCLKDGTDWRKIDGIAWRRDHEIVVNNPRKVIEDLSLLPKADRNTLCELRKRNLKISAASMYTSRGCYGQCIYCSAPTISSLSKDKKWRGKSPEAVVEEMKYLVDCFGVEFIYLCDDNFFGYGLDRDERLKKLATLMIENNIKVKIHAEIRVDAKIDMEVLELLKKAGLYEVLLGIESGSQAALNRWKKGVTVEKNMQAVDIARELGFQLEPAFIMCDPYSTVEEFKENVQFIKDTELHKCKNPLYLFNQMIVYPGTGLETKLIQEGLVQQNDIWNIQENLDNAEELLDYCNRVSTYKYTIQNEKFRDLWDAMVHYINILTYYSDVLFPRVLGKWKKANLDNKEQKLENIRKYKKWKKNISTLVMDILEVAAKWGEQDEKTQNLNNTLESLILNYNQEYLGSLLEMPEMKEGAAINV